MLAVVGAASIDDLFVDVPEAARLAGTIEGLPDHASELGVERQLGALARGATSRRATCPSSSAAAPIATISRPASIISSSAASS